MVRLNKIADKVDNGWVRVMECLVTEVPLDNPLGPAVINLLVDECPLPTKVCLYICNFNLLHLFYLIIGMRIYCQV